MAMAAIPSFVELCIEGSIDGRWEKCQLERPERQEFWLYDNIVFCHNDRMSTSTSRNSRVFTISFPEDLAKQVVTVAEEESRNISELFREAFRVYRLERIHRKLDQIRAEAATRGPVQYTEDDVEALVDEIRAEQYARRKLTA
jgi:predicted transcriptional regulator